VRANTLCSSERGQFQHGSVVTPGHEAAGVAAAAGAGTSTALGTPGVFYLMDFWGTCRSCAARADYGFSRDGGYAPYEVVRESVFFPAELPLDLATLLLDVWAPGAMPSAVPGWSISTRAPSP